MCSVVQCCSGENGAFIKQELGEGEFQGTGGAGGRWL